MQIAGFGQIYLPARAPNAKKAAYARGCSVSKKRRDVARRTPSPVKNGFLGKRHNATRSLQFFRLLSIEHKFSADALDDLCAQRFGEATRRVLCRKRAGLQNGELDELTFAQRLVHALDQIFTDILFADLKDRFERVRHLAKLRALRSGHTAPAFRPACAGNPCFEA